jgi:hypothetical protein
MCRTNAAVLICFAAKVLGGFAAGCFARSVDAGSVARARRRLLPEADGVRAAEELAESAAPSRPSRRRFSSAARDRDWAVPLALPCVTSEVLSTRCKNCRAYFRGFRAVESLLSDGSISAWNFAGDAFAGAVQQCHVAPCALHVLEEQHFPNEAPGAPFTPAGRAASAEHLRTVQQRHWKSR